MRESQYRILRDKLNDKINNAARVFVRYMRAYLDRKKFLQARKAAIAIQVKIRTFSLVFLVAFKYFTLFDTGVFSNFMTGKHEKGSPKFRLFFFSINQ